MRTRICALVLAIGLGAHPAFAQADRGATAFWRSVQATCNATAATPASALGRRIARAAIDEFNRFGGHEIDVDGRLLRFGLTEAEHARDDGDLRPTSLDHLGWWRVMAYWRALYDDDPTDKLEVLGFRDASTATAGTQEAAVLRTSAARLLRLADDVADPEQREVLREAAMRAAVVDTPWSAAFISYVVRQAGVPAPAFRFSNAHRAYIYEAFATSTAETRHQPSEQIYRACPLATTKPRVGDLLCYQREPALAGADGAAVRERIRAELDGDARTVRRTHCEVVAHVDVAARKLYVIGGNVQQAVTAKKLNLRGRDLKLSVPQTGACRPGHWTLPGTADDAPQAARLTQKCSLDDRKWFVLLQLR